MSIARVKDKMIQLCEAMLNDDESPTAILMRLIEHADRVKVSGDSRRELVKTVLRTVVERHQHLPSNVREVLLAFVDGSQADVAFELIIDATKGKFDMARIRGCVSNTISACLRRENSFTTDSTEISTSDRV